MRLSSVRSSSVRSAAPGTPTVLLLHGYGTDEHDLAGLGPLVSDVLPWAAVRAPLALRSGGHGWFPITTPGTPDPRALADATDVLWEWVDAELGPDDAVLPVGFSQGGVMATQLLRTRPDRVAATVVLGGFVAGDPQPADDALAATRPPVFWGRGQLDGVIAAHAIARTRVWLPAHATLVERVYPGLGHGIDAAELADVRSFVTRTVRPEPSRT